jgi:hypothetical protein
MERESGVSSEGVARERKGRRQIRECRLEQVKHGLAHH